MLSSQTKDEITDGAISKLRAALGGSISIDGIIGADDSVISQAIAKVGFWRRKTGYLKKSAQKLRDDFDSDVPKTVDDLCSLPGVGPKMAFLALQTAWKLWVSPHLVSLRGRSLLWYRTLGTQESESTCMFTGLRIDSSGISLRPRTQRGRGSLCLFNSHRTKLISGMN